MKTSKRTRRSILVYRDLEYPNHDKIEIPVLFHLTDDGKRVYDEEEMKQILEDEIESIIEFEKKHYE